MVLESNRDLVQRRLIETLSRDRTKHQVAEVTSLGLVQMTRKKLGLGLLESFSEPCEVCAGRGIVVHHEPVSKHRSSSNSGSGSSSSGGQSRSSRNRGSESAKTAPSGTHGITEDAKNALAAIAASTIAPSDGDSEDDGPGIELDLSSIPAASKRPERSAEQVDDLLGSVLEALPEPSAPGSGRSRRRRASRPAGKNDES